MEAQAEEGDIFEFGIAPSVKAFGQVLAVHLGMEFLVVIFQEEHPITVDQSHVSLSEKDVLLIGIALDAKFYHGNWKVVGKRDRVLPEAMWPIYKVQRHGRMIAVDFHQQELRRKPSRDLPFRTTWSPVVFEAAFKSTKGRTDKNEKFRPLYFGKQ